MRILRDRGKNGRGRGRLLCLGTALAVTLSMVQPPISAFAGPGTEPVQTVGEQSQSTAAPTVADAQLFADVEKPVVEAQGAVLYDVTHNQILFEQNGEIRFYPASITKLMTALLVAESCDLDSTVTFSQTAVSNLESGAVTLNIKAGDQFSVRDCLYGLLLKSANEIGNGLAEHTAGSIEAFVERMNQKAAALGCTNTHFANTNGLNSTEHYTTARDMALIAKAAFDNDIVRQVASTLTYEFPATASVPSVRKLTMGHKMLNPANSEYYPGIIGGKTGYTSLAGNTLVTCVEKDGVRLIAVVLKSKLTHYSDTKKMLDYGFAVAGRVGGQAQTQSGSGAGPTAAGSEAAPGQSQSVSSEGQNNGLTYPGQSTSAAGQSTSPSQGEQSDGSNSYAYPGANRTNGGFGESGASSGTSSGQSQAVTTGQTASGASQTGPGGGTSGAAVNTAVKGPEAYPEASGRWVESGSSWQFVKEDGSYASNEYLRINGKAYGFGSDSLMLKGWQAVNGHWRYFDETNGDMAFSRWIETNGYWYYVDEYGALFVNGTTPDGHQVDANGIWIQ